MHVGACCFVHVPCASTDSVHRGQCPLPKNVVCGRHPGVPQSPAAIERMHAQDRRASDWLPNRQHACRRHCQCAMRHGRGRQGGFSLKWGLLLPRVWDSQLPLVFGTQRQAQYVGGSVELGARSMRASAMLAEVLLILLGPCTRPDIMVVPTHAAMCHMAVPLAVGRATAALQVQVSWCRRNGASLTNCQVGW